MSVLMKWRMKEIHCRNQSWNHDNKSSPTKTSSLRMPFFSKIFCESWDFTYKVPEKSCEDSVVLNYVLCINNNNKPRYGDDGVIDFDHARPRIFFCSSVVISLAIFM